MGLVLEWGTRFDEASEGVFGAFDEFGSKVNTPGATTGIPDWAEFQPMQKRVAVTFMRRGTMAFPARGVR